jgi:hypothetical protein
VSKQVTTLVRYLGGVPLQKPADGDSDQVLVPHFYVPIPMGSDPSSAGWGTFSGGAPRLGSCDLMPSYRNVTVSKCLSENIRQRIVLFIALCNAASGAPRCFHKALSTAFHKREASAALLLTIIPAAPPALS